MAFPTVEFVENVDANLHRMCQQVMSATDDAATIETLGEAFVFFAELVELTQPRFPREVRELAESRVDAASDAVLLAAHRIANRRLRVMEDEDG